MRRYRWLAGLTMMGLLLMYPQPAVEGAQAAMYLWYKNVAPSLFPFMALMPLITCADAMRAYEALLGGVMRGLFDLPGAAAPAFFTGMVAGSPAGAIAVRRVAARGGMNAGEARRLAGAVCGLSPAFLLSSVGAGMLGSIHYGRILAGAQLTAQILTAVLLRLLWKGKRFEERAERDDDPDVSARGPVQAILSVCGYMAFFGALARVARHLLGKTAGDAILCALDMPSGAKLISELPCPVETKVLVIAAMAGFGGVCVLAQNIGALGQASIGVPELLFARLLSAALTALSAFVFIHIPDLHALSAFRYGVLGMAALVIPILVMIKCRGVNN